MSITTSATRRYRSPVAGALLALAMLLAPAATAKAQDTERRITTPRSQSSVPVDEPFTVAGDGCPPESSVTVTVGGGRFEATTTADETGAYSTSLTLPSSSFDFDAEIFDINEFVITGTCGNVRLSSGVLVPASPSQVGQIPSGGVQTGAGGTARMAPPLLAARLRSWVVARRAAPAAVASAAPPVSIAAPPVSVAVPSVGINSKLVRLGLRKDRTMQVPSDDDLAGWYVHGPQPGEVGPAIIAGHVDSTRGPAVFFHLRDLARGDRIEVGRADGSVAVFQVNTVEQYSKHRFPTAKVYGDLDHAGLRLITCGGDFDRSRGHYPDNIVVYASLTGHP